jgi:hypothetical protein
MPNVCGLVGIIVACVLPAEGAADTGWPEYGK